MAIGLHSDISFAGSALHVTSHFIWEHIFISECGIHGGEARISINLASYTIVDPSVIAINRYLAEWVKLWRTIEEVRIWSIERHVRRRIKSVGSRVGFSMNYNRSWAWGFGFHVTVAL